MIEAITMLRQLHADRKAVTALEYGLIAATILAVAATAFTTLGSKLTTVISNATPHHPIT